MGNCRQVETPELNLIVDECGGKLITTDCVVVVEAYPEINVSKGDKLTEVVTKLVENSRKLYLENKFYKDKIEEIYKQINM